ncbi:hypothetical protein DBV15_00605 [Temnothorax longispinosus]|uniref:Uncharacterized protein n=1 Tax=Temnothorax longispinosus TaxID=300112 RepID=A0A4S2KSK9_9HYME|nr:hypothetical protein DBV15_00605 [Temnothorax longispinosus]
MQRKKELIAGQRESRRTPRRVGTILIEEFETRPRLIGGISLPCRGNVCDIAHERNGLNKKSPGAGLSKTEPRETSCVTVVLEFRCSQQRDSLSSNGHTLLNIPVDDKVPSAALSPPLVFVGQRDSLRRLPGDCNNIFCAEAHEGCATNERTLTIITSTQSQIAVDNHLLQHSLSAVLRRSLFDVVFPRKRSPDLRGCPRCRSAKRERKSAREAVSSVRGERLLARASVLERKWGRAGRAHLTPKHHCLHSPDDPAREASCRPIRSTHSTRLVCVCDDPAGPVFWPRLTRALGACSPRSHPSGHALFHPGERIVRLGLEARRRVIINQPVLSVANRRGCPANGRRACSTVTDGVRERIEVGQDLISSGTGDCSGAGRTVAPRNANRWKPGCWNVRVATPTHMPSIPSIHSHEDTDRNAEGRFTISVMLFRPMNHRLYATCTQFSWILISRIDPGRRAKILHTRQLKLEPPENSEMPVTISKSGNVPRDCHARSSNRGNRFPRVALSLARTVHASVAERYDCAPSITPLQPCLVVSLSPPVLDRLPLPTSPCDRRHHHLLLVLFTSMKCRPPPPSFASSLPPTSVDLHPAGRRRGWRGGIAPRRRRLDEKGRRAAHRKYPRKEDGSCIGNRRERRMVARDIGTVGTRQEEGRRGTKETCRREEEFEGVGCRHRRGRRRFLPRCRRRRPPPPPPSPPSPPLSSCRRRFSTPGRQAGRLLPFFLLFPIIDKTETAQYRDAAPRRGLKGPAEHRRRKTRRRERAGVHGSAGGAGGDGGGGRSDLTRLAGRNKLATRALVPSVPLAIGACRFLSRTGDVSIGLTDSFLHRRDSIDLSSFATPFRHTAGLALILW